MAKCKECGNSEVELNTDGWYTCKVCGNTSNIGEEW